MDEETVKIRVEIDIRTAGTHDTGLTVAAWNALTAADRSRIAQDVWADAASNGDNGGIWVETDNAMEC